MSEILGSVWWLVVTLSVLITFHEFGHFFVARRFGVRVLRFSIGFGKALWSRRDRDGTEYVIAAIPLGGYVKMLDEREAEVAVADLGHAFNRKPVGARIAIVAAGPLFNLVFAVFAFWLMFTVGKPDYLPLVGRAEGAAAAAGFERGDRLLRVDGEAVSTWTDASLALVRAAIDRKAVPVEVMDAHATTRTRQLDLSQVAPDGEAPSLRDLGLYPKQFLLPPVIGSVDADTPAARAGIVADDRIVAIDGQAVATYDELPGRLQAAAGDDGAIVVALQRRGATIELPARLEQRDNGGRRMWVLGVHPKEAAAQTDTEIRYGPIEAVPMAFAETWRMTGETIGILVRMVTGRASLKNLSGPISIAQFANASAQQGVGRFLFFLGLLSLSIGILNLLPIPILDGGHLLYYLIESVKGSPLSERAMAAGQYVGLVLLAGLIGLAFYNDILRPLS
jgi:regulator of sigma E protease